jgi:hypothetical protein
MFLNVSLRDTPLRLAVKKKMRKGLIQELLIGNITSTL